VIDLTPFATPAGVVLAGIVGAWSQRFVARRQARLDARRVDTDDWRAVTDALRQDLDAARTRLDFVERERGLDHAWIDLLREHISLGKPPPPPTRPTS